MHALTRRDALKSLGISALGLSLARWSSAVADEPSPMDTFSAWRDQFYQNGVDLSEQKISPLQWQEVMDDVYRATPMAKLKEKLDFTNLCKSILEKMPADRPEFFQSIDLEAPAADLNVAGPEPPRRLIVKIAHVRKGHSVPPHGHSNMVSAFLCLSGEFNVRLYDRLDNREDQLVVRQTVHDKAAGPGTWSSISDYRDNVHWLTAVTDDCFLFTCKMLSVEDGLPLKGRINIDLHRARKLGSETFVAPVITHEEAREIY